MNTSSAGSLASINVSAGGDNMFDIWFRFNRMDPIDTAYITCLSAGMRTDEEVREAFEMTTSRPATMMGLTDRKVAEGCPADLVVHSARNLVDAGSLTIVAVVAEPVGGETTEVTLNRDLAATGRFPALDLAARGAIRPELLVGDEGAEALAQARWVAL